MRRIARLTAPVAVLATALACAAPAGATSGEITRAEASADWTIGSIAGSVTWTRCDIGWAEAIYWDSTAPTWPTEPEWPTVPTEPLEPPYCGWIPFVTVGPGSDADACTEKGRRWPGSLGEGIELIWSESERRWPGTRIFDVDGFALSGQPGQMACLSLLEIAPRSVLCAAVMGIECSPYMMGWSSQFLAAASLTAAAPEPEIEPVPSTTEPEIESVLPTTEPEESTKPARSKWIDIRHHRRHGHVRKK